MVRTYLPVFAAACAYTIAGATAHHLLWLPPLVAVVAAAVVFVSAGWDAWHTVPGGVYCIVRLDGRKT